MIFEKITLENFASYRGCNEIILQPESGEKPIILVGGENGCGKTSLLDALQLVLFGPLAQCSNRGKQSYDNYLKKCINNQVEPGEGAVIELLFRFDADCSEKKFNIRRSWSVKNRKLSEHFSVYKIEDGKSEYDRVLSENWLDYLESFFPSSIAPFFLFDGEKIEQLADFEKSGPIIQSAVNSLLGLDHIDRLDTDLLTLEKRQHKKIASREDLNDLEEIEVEGRRIEEQIRELEQSIASSNNDLDRINKKLEENEVRYKLSGGELFDRRIELEFRLEKAKEYLQQCEDELRFLAAGSGPMLLVENLLGEVLADVKAEHEAQRAALVLEDLSRRDRKLLQLTRSLEIEEAALAEIENFLAQDRHSMAETANQPTFLNLSSADYLKLDSLVTVELPKLKQELPGRIDKVHAATAELDNYERMLSSIPEEAVLARVIEERKQLKESFVITEKLKNNAVEELEKAHFHLERNRQTLHRKLEALAEVNLENRNYQRVVEYSQKTRETLARFRERVLDSHLCRIEQLVLESFQQLLRKSDLVAKLTINRKTFCLHLYNDAGQEITPERLSAGERQLLATAILWGLCRAAGKPLPTIIDTPLGRLDKSHRKNLIFHYFPQASHQVILLSTDEEIVGDHLRNLQPYISRRYLLSHNQGATKIIPGYFFERLGEVA